MKRFFPAPEVCDRFRGELLGVFVSFHHLSLAAFRFAVYRFAVEVQNSRDCVPDNFVFIQSSFFRVLTNSACVLRVSNCVSVDFC